MISKQVSTVELVVAFIWEILKQTEILFEAQPLFLFSSSMYVYYFRFPSRSSGKPANPLSTWV